MLARDALHVFIRVWHSPKAVPRVPVPKLHMLQTISTCLILVAFSRSHSPLAGSGGRSGLSQPQALAPSTAVFADASIHTSLVPTLCLPPKLQELSGDAGPSFGNVSLSCLSPPATGNCHRDCTSPSCSLCLCSQMRRWDELHRTHINPWFLPSALQNHHSVINFPMEKQ